MLCRTSCQYVESEGSSVGVPPHEVGQYRPAQSLALMLRIDVEVFEPLTIWGRPQGDASRSKSIQCDDLRVLGLESVEKALAHTYGIVAIEAFKIIFQHDCTQLSNPLCIGFRGCPERKGGLHESSQMDTEQACKLWR